MCQNCDVGLLSSISVRTRHLWVHRPVKNPSGLQLGQKRAGRRLFQRIYCLSVIWWTPTVFSSTPAPPDPPRISAPTSSYFLQTQFSMTMTSLPKTSFPVWTALTPPTTKGHICPLPSTVSRSRIFHPLETEKGRGRATLAPPICSWRVTVHLSWNEEILKKNFMTVVHHEKM